MLDGQVPAEPEEFRHREVSDINGVVGGVYEGCGTISGDQFWLYRSSYCPKATEFNRGYAIEFNEPRHLYAAICEYFQCCQDHPLEKQSIASFQGVVRSWVVQTPRPFTIQGLLTFLGARQSHWNRWCQDQHLNPVTEWAYNVIEQQKYEGAISGTFNPTIIMRELGIEEVKNQQPPEEETQKESALDVIESKLSRIASRS